MQGYSGSVAHSLGSAPVIVRVGHTENWPVPLLCLQIGSPCRHWGWVMLSAACGFIEGSMAVHDISIRQRNTSCNKGKK